MPKLYAGAGRVLHPGRPRRRQRVLSSHSLPRLPVDEVVFNLCQGGIALVLGS
ncbi:hypothetical protein ABZ614_45390 [Streptomyces sp. NPDC013178]|uniref:hypothetical protein n=1 Tax=Streptomyces sp. NPDC013178 TaxID=3155118 RepID=UPI0033CB2BAA